jgi:hypothetical protein
MAHRLERPVRRVRRRLPALVVLGVAGWAPSLWIFAHPARDPAVTPGKLASA